MKKILLIISVITLLTPTLAPAQTQAATTGNKSIVLPPETVNLKSAKGLDVVQANCLICHSGDYISMQPPFTKAQWTAEVQKMVKVMGAKITEANTVIISDYLAENYGSRK